MFSIFNRGVQLPYLKEPAASKPIVDLDLPSTILIPLYNSDHGHCNPSVQVDQNVSIGQELAHTNLQKNSKNNKKELTGGVFAPLAGKVIDIRQINHSLYGEVLCAEISVDKDNPTTNQMQEKIDIKNLTSNQIIYLAKQANIVDELDGYNLSTKLQKASEIVQSSADGPNAIQIVVDASEQQPYTSCSWALLKEASDDVHQGLKLVTRAINCNICSIAVKLPYMRRRELSGKLPELIKDVGNRYPSYPAKSKTPPVLIGVQACLALYHAAMYGNRQNHIVVTVAGDAIKKPQNVRIPIGTPAQDLLNFCGISKEANYLVFGDALTGISVPDSSQPLVAGINCLLAFNKIKKTKKQTCIGCGWCVKACHKNLLPYEIMRRVLNMQFERLPALLPSQCDGCGACSYVCPSGLDVSAQVIQAGQTDGTISVSWGDNNGI